MERKVKTVLRIFICAVMMGFFFGCTYSVNETSTEQTERVTEEQTADEKTIPSVQEDDPQKENADDRTEVSEATTEASVGTELVYPEYSGEAYIELNDNVPLSLLMKRRLVRKLLKATVIWISLDGVELHLRTFVLN